MLAIKLLCTAIAIGSLVACSQSGKDRAYEYNSPNFASSCNGNCATLNSHLSIAEVEQILAQAIAEAQAQNVNATIAIVDRVGNVLAVYRMGDAGTRSLVIASALNTSGEAVIDGGLEGIKLPSPGVPFNLDDQAAISKAITGAYLSSEGNAFSTRTAGQIIQENFNPGEINQPAGPLFGVQFSQLACSDFTVNDATLSQGPKRSPLGLAADAGGFPLYKSGTPVGGIGVIADGVYSLDKNISHPDRNIDELIAYAGTFAFEAPVERRADRIAVDGKTLRYSDIHFSDLNSDPAQAGSFGNIPPGVGNIIPVFGYSDGSLRAGVAFGQIESGIRAATAAEFPADLDAFVFVDNANNPRFAARNGTDSLLSAAEVQTLLESALAVANQTRAQIRRPYNSPARVTIAVVDTQGEILGMVRSRDAPVFGADVSIQKARTAVFFSSADAASFLLNQPDAKYFDISNTALELSTRQAIDISQYLVDLRSFIAEPSALSTGDIAFTDRAGGNLSRPFYPDGLAATAPGPLSKPAGSWSVFSTGLQLDLIFNGIIQHVLTVASNGLLNDVGDNCTGVDFEPETLNFVATATGKQLANGNQIFPGSVPIYRNNILIGGIGVSGDGVDQDDMISFLGVAQASTKLSGTINNAPIAKRADNLSPQGVRLRYVQCPQAPFLNNTQDNVCADL